MALRARRRRRPPSPLRRVLLWAVLGVVAVLVVSGAFAARHLIEVDRDLRTARTLIDDATTAVEDGQLARGRQLVEQARQILVATNGTLHRSLSLQVVGLLPVVHQNLESVRQTVGLSLLLAGGGSQLLDVSRPLEGADGKLEVPLRNGAVPLDVVVRAQIEAAGLATSLPGPNERPSDRFLVAPVREAQELVFDQVALRRRQLLNLANGLDLIAEMSGAAGPRRYLIAVANTAEMRATGGMILSYGVLESEDGRFTLPAFGQIDELALATAVPPETAPVAEDEAGRWAGLEPTRLWRNANEVPDMDVVGPRLEAMYEQATRQTADGVIQIDVEGLAAILGAIGPVQVEGLGQVTAENVVDLVLNQAYFRFADDQDQRREVLGDVAEEVFDRLVNGEYPSLRPLGENLAEAAAARHVILWSSTPKARQAAEFFQADGSLLDPAVGDSLLLTVQNFGRDKLDYYLDSTVTVTGERPRGAEGHLQVTVTLTNNAPPGNYLGTASLYVPNGATVEQVSGDGDPGPLVTENGRPVMGVAVQVPAGETRSFTVDLRLPTPRPGPAGFALLPVPRVHPTVWEIDIEAPGGPIRHTGPVEAPVLLRPGPA